MQRQIIWDEYKSEQFLSKYVPVVKSVKINVKDLQTFSFSGVKFPCFLKIISDKAVHKVKCGLVFELKSIKDFIKNKNKILLLSKKYSAKFVIVQEKVFGDELIVGIKEDAKFGKLLMIGIGGKFAEKLNDVSFRVLPVTKKDVLVMLNDLYNKSVVSKVDVNMLWLFVKKLIAVLSTKEGKKIKFIDLNPVILDANKEGKPIIVDARIYF